MAKQKRRRTVEEVLRELEADPAYRARMERQQALQRKGEDELRRAEEPIVKALNHAGISVTSVWDLVNTSAPYPLAIPILLEHLHKPYPARVRESIARALAVPEARFAWTMLREMFVTEQDATGSGLKWALGCALAGAADDDVLEDVIELVLDTRHGVNRAALLSALDKSPRPRAREVLLGLRKDPQLAQAARQVIRGELRR
jgi:HEAT repeat protein